jgi:hypothetical protein
VSFGDVEIDEQLRDEPAASRFELILRRDRIGVAIHDGHFQIRLPAKQREDFRDVIQGLPLRSASGPFGGYSFLSIDWALRSRSSLPSRFLPRKRPVLRDRARNHGGELAPEVLELRFEISDARIARTKLGAIGGELLHQHVHVLPGIGKRAFARARGQVPFLLAQIKRAGSKLRVAPQLLKVRARRVVLVFCALLGEPERPFPLWA